MDYKQEIEEASIKLMEEVFEKASQVSEKIMRGEIPTLEDINQLRLMNAAIKEIIKTIDENP